MRRNSFRRFLLDALPVLVPAALVLFWVAHESYQMDFRAFFVAGKSCLENLDPYWNHADLGPEFRDSLNGRPGSRFSYPPFAALAFLPVATLPYVVAKQFFSVLLGVAFLVVAYLSAEDLEPPPREAVFVAALSMPVLTTFERGQVDLLLVAAVLAAWRLSGSRRSLAAAVLVALAGAVKIIPLALAGLWVAHRRLLLTSLLALVSLSLWLLPIPILGEEAYRSFFSQLTSVSAPPSASPSLISLRDFVGVFSPDGVGLTVMEDETRLILRYDLPGKFVHRVNPLARVGPAACLAAGVVLMTYFSWRTRRLGAMPQLFATLPALNVLNPMSWTMGLVWFLPFFLSRYARATWIGRLALLVPLFLPGSLTVRGFGFEAAASLVVVVIFLLAEERRGTWSGLVVAPGDRPSPLAH